MYKKQNTKQKTKTIKREDNSRTNGYKNEKTIPTQREKALIAAAYSPPTKIVMMRCDKTNHPQIAVERLGRGYVAGADSLQW